MMKKKFLAAGFVMASLAMAMSAQAEGEKVIHAGSANWNFGASNLDPADEWNGWYMEFMGVAETLFKQSNAYEAVPTLVESYEEPEDGVTWKFTLRDDVTFSNGEKMTAQSVVDCLTRTYAENARATETLPLADMSADGQELTMVAVQPDPTFLYTLCDPLLSIYYVGEDEDYDNGASCTGPFVVESFVPVSETVLVKNENYWGGEVKLDKAVLTSFEDSDAMIMAMQNGELDWIDDAANGLLVCNEMTGFSVVSCDTSRANKIQFNYENDICNDPVIREVVALAIDREGYAALSNGVYKANYGIYPNALAYGDNSKLDIKITAKDLEKAAAVLDEAGYVDADGDGLREIDGTPISLKVVTGSGTGVQDLIDVLTSDMAGIGVNVTSEIYESLEAADQFEGLVWDLYIDGKYMTPTGDAAYFFEQDACTGGSFNFGKYSNEKIDELEAKLRVTFDEEERNALVFEMEQILLDENAFVVFANGTNTYITSQRLVGYEPCPSNYYFMSEKMDIAE